MIHSETSQSVKPKVGVSACVVGEKVRYNGGSAAIDWVVEELGAHAELIPLCPELAMGLTVPRPAMRLRKGDSGVELVTSNEGRAMTETARAAVARLLGSLPDDLDGFILMGRSPLCGPSRVKVYGSKGVPSFDGVGIFAAALAEARPRLAMIEAGRLTEPRQREQFVTRLFVQARASRIVPRVAELQAFHRGHKFLILAHGRVYLDKLGAIAAAVRPSTIDKDIERYRSTLSEALATPYRRSSAADALTHVYGFVKRRMGESERRVLLREIDDYRQGRVGMVRPTTVLELFGRRDFRPYADMRFGDER